MIPIAAVGFMPLCRESAEAPSAGPTWPTVRLRFGGSPEWCYAKGQNQFERSVALYVRFEANGTCVVEPEDDAPRYPF